jgi:hypothetical protein
LLSLQSYFDALRSNHVVVTCCGSTALILEFARIGEKAMFGSLQFWRILRCTIVALLLLCSLPVQADTCTRRIRNAETRLAHAIRRYGRNSRQADHRRLQLRLVREHCHGRRI